MFSWFTLKKLAPTIVLIMLLLLAGGTNVFSQTMHELVGESFREFLLSIKSQAANILLVLVAVNLYWLGFRPAVHSVERVLRQMEIEPGTRQLLSKTFRLGYWALMVLSTLSFFSINLTVLMVGLGLLLKTPAEAFTSSFLLYSCDALKASDRVEFIDKAAVQGKVLSVGYFATKIETGDGVFTIPNNKVWDSLVKVQKPGTGDITESTTPAE